MAVDNVGIRREIAENWLCARIIATRDGDRVSVLESDDDFKMKSAAMS